MKKELQIGDIVEIPLADSRKAYAQYVYFDNKFGPIIQVFDEVIESDVNVDHLMERLKVADLLFPPVFVGLFAAIKSELWAIVGHMSVTNFRYPGFVSVMHECYIQKGHWYFWDGEKNVKLGRRLPRRYQHMEFLAIWSPYDIAHRILKGENPYEKLIKGK